MEKCKYKSNDLLNCNSNVIGSFKSNCYKLDKQEIKYSILFISSYRDIKPVLTISVCSGSGHASRERGQALRKYIPRPGTASAGEMINASFSDRAHSLGSAAA